MLTRSTGALHANRWSLPGARYFVTLCTMERHTGLTTNTTASAIRNAVMAADAVGDTETLAFTVMPDHIHWLFHLGGRLSLGRVIARYKAETRAELQAGHRVWQHDFYEHRLRAEEGAEDYGRYVILNPYRAGLLCGGNWPGWLCPKPEQFGFMTQLKPDGAPQREWIAEPRPAGLMVGE